MLLRYTRSGHLYISPQDDCRLIVDAMLITDYKEEFCVADSFCPEFSKNLMEAGFLLMSAKLNDDDDDDTSYIMLPKLHLERSALFFENLHIKKSIKRLLNKYELHIDTDFDKITDRCVEKHGADWLTPPLMECIKKIRKNAETGCDNNSSLLVPNSNAYPASFALYRDGELKAGEFGVVYGNVYTSYSGFYDEDNAGTVQLILTTKYLQEKGFSFFDLGMPMDYKNDLGAVNITPEEFVSLFRSR